MRPPRGRDRLGRPVPLGSPDVVPEVGEEPLPPAEALAFAQKLLEQDRAFNAHEVLEASWKTAPAGERDLWQGLAQVCVGATHLQRGNLVGAVRLLHRGAGRLQGRADDVRAWALRLADEVESGQVQGGAREAPWSGSGGRLRLPGTR
ncbi:MAG: aromatic ring-opening dioxygenase LigA [Frankiales bacterium]|nr:aromatic ring-opening dioxygenase LigA [Frankiales bacterium]